MTNFQKVKNYLIDLELNITYENEDNGVLKISSENDGISNLVIACADPILIMEQFIVQISPNSTNDIYRRLLQKNRDIVHGAFVLDDSATRVIFRDTLQLENLDRNELEASINSLSLLMGEYSGEILGMSA